MFFPTHVPVIIIGGGIVGLSASLFLSAQNIPSLLIERRPSTSIHPRARGVNRRSVELYRGLDIDEILREAGADLSPTRGLYKGSSLAEVVEPHKRRVGPPRKFSPGASFFESVSPVGGGLWGTQDVIEPVLLKAARERGGDLRFNVEYTSFEQDDAGVVRATLRDRETGSEFLVCADYLIAADGAGSAIRRKLGVGTTTGAGTLGYLLNVLFEADLAEFVRGREFSQCYVDRPEVRGIITSINNSNRWVMHVSYDPNKGEKIEDFPPQRCQELIKIALGMPEKEVVIRSILPWEPTVQVAEKFQHGRIFLAGDAAHQMPPWGGQGANTGIADVHNLAWKLAAVLNKEAPATLLTTYDDERLPMGRLNAEESGAAADENGLFALNKTFGAARALIRRIPRIAGYGYVIHSQAINTEDTTPFIWRQRWLLQFTPWMLSLGGAVATRVPHMWVQRAGQRVSTLDLVGKSFVLLAGADGGEWCEAAGKVTSSVGVDLMAYRAGPTGDIVCSKGEWESSAWISSRGALLVRPDGFVAWRAWDQPSDLQQKLKEVLMQALCRER